MSARLSDRSPEWYRLEALCKMASAICEMPDLPAEAHHPANDLHDALVRELEAEEKAGRHRWFEENKQTVLLWERMA